MTKTNQKSKGVVLINSDGKILRFLSTKEENLCVVLNNTNKRIQIISETEFKSFDKGELTKIKDFKLSSVQKRKIKIDDELSIKSYQGNSTVRSEIQPTKDKEDKLPVIMKYSAIGHIAAIFLMIVVSWSISYFMKPNEPTIVQVFKQSPKVQRVVRAQKKKVRKSKPRKARVSNKNRVAKNSRVSKRKSRTNRRKAAQNVNKMGALGVLGGLNKKMTGSGGLNVKAAKNNAGSGYGGPAARGGHSRALVGKGLVASGTGSSGSVKGYGGYGTSGKGGGKPGFGARKLGGSSNGSLYALSDEALIQGGLDMDQINAVVIRNRGQFSQCYERALQSNARMNGSVNIKFTISANGKVSRAKVSRTSINTRSFESCLVSKLRGWRFPKPVGSVSVRVDYPFMFKRNG